MKGTTSDDETENIIAPFHPQGEQSIQVCTQGVIPVKQIAQDYVTLLTAFQKDLPPRGGKAIMVVFI